MTRETTTKGIEWCARNLPVSRRYGDAFYSAEDGLAETRHVYLDANNLPERFAEAESFAIGELGFGTGLSFLAVLDLWRRVAPDDAHLTFTSFEIDPLGRDDIARALSPWSEIAPLVAELLDGWTGSAGTFDLPGVTLTLVVGDARETVPRWSGQNVDAWILDGFAPARNPEMWETDLIDAVYARTRTGGTFATFSAAGAVRRALIASGFAVQRIPGFGAKREMLCGQR